MGGSFAGGCASLAYIYIVLYLKKVGPGGGAEHIYIYIHNMYLQFVSRSDQSGWSTSLSSHHLSLQDSI